MHLRFGGSVSWYTSDEVEVYLHGVSDGASAQFLASKWIVELFIRELYAPFI